MALNPSPPKNSVLVAIDVAKRRNEVLIAFPGAVQRKRLSVLNARAEHDRFISYLIGLDAARGSVVDLSRFDGAIYCELQHVRNHYRDHAPEDKRQNVCGRADSHLIEDGVIVASKDDRRWEHDRATGRRPVAR